MLFKKFSPNRILITPERAYFFRYRHGQLAPDDSFSLEHTPPDLSREVFSILLCPMHWVCLQKGGEEFYLTPHQQSWLNSLVQQSCLVAKVVMVPQALMIARDYGCFSLPLPTACGYHVFNGGSCHLSRWWQAEDTTADRHFFEVFCQRYSQKAIAPDVTWHEGAVDFKHLPFLSYRNRIVTLFAAAHRRFCLFVVGWGLVGLMTVVNVALVAGKLCADVPARDLTATAAIIAYQQWYQQGHPFRSKEVARVMASLKGQGLLVRLSWDGMSYTMLVRLTPPSSIHSIARARIKVINAKAGIYKITVAAMTGPQS